MLSVYIKERKVGGKCRGKVGGNFGGGHKSEGTKGRKSQQWKCKYHFTEATCPQEDTTQKKKKTKQNKQKKTTKRNTIL